MWPERSGIGRVNRTLKRPPRPTSGAVAGWTAATRYTATAIAVASKGTRVRMGGRGPGGYMGVPHRYRRHRMIQQS